MPTAGVIRTVLGDIPAASLGTTLIHEHVIGDFTCDWAPESGTHLAAARVELATLADLRRNVAAARDNLILGDLQVAQAELDRYRRAGGAAMVEATPSGLGRDVRALRFLATQTGLHILAGSGYYSRQSHPYSLLRRTPEDIADEIVHDIEVGIDGTDIRAGVIGELGASNPLDDVERRVLHAAALAQRTTGAAIVVHTPLGERAPLDVARTLADLGADLTRVVISHAEARFRSNHGLYRELAGMGAVIGFDTFGRDLYYASRGAQHPSDAERVEAIVRLVDAGLGHQVALSQDIAAKTELATYGGRGYDHVLVEVVPRLVRAGLTQRDVDVLLVETPARVLALAPTQASEGPRPSG